MGGVLQLEKDAKRAELMKINVEKLVY